MLSGCGIEEMIRKNDDRYATPGALDLPMMGVNDVYHVTFLDCYKIKHEWPRISNCEYRKVATLGIGTSVLTDRGEVYIARDIYEADGKTWQRFPSEIGPYDFDYYARSVISKRKEYKDINGETQVYEPREEGYHPLCFVYWQRTSSYMRFRFQKRTLAAFKKIFDEQYPEGRWSQRRFGKNIWTVQEVPEKGLRDAPSDGSLGGPYQNWLLPIGDTGYTIAIEFGANRKTLEYPEAFEELKSVFKHLLESVEIEPL